MPLPQKRPGPPGPGPSGTGASRGTAGGGGTGAKGTQADSSNDGTNAAAAIFSEIWCAIGETGFFDRSNAVAIIRLVCASKSDICEFLVGK